MPEPAPQQPSPLASDSDAPAAAAGEVRIGEDGRAYVSVRRRKRRRASGGGAPLASPGRSGRVQAALLAFIGVLIVFALAGNGVRSRVIESLRQTAPALAQFARYRVEVIALVFAAGVVLYLMPGVEERVLAFLGIKKRRRHSERRHRDRGGAPPSD